MENVIISTAFLIMALIIFWQVGEIKKHHETMTVVLKAINESINMFNDFIDQSNQKEADTVKTLQEICTALNTAYQTEQLYMTQTSTALHNIILCMIPFIDDIKAIALDNEDYERAKECSKILSNLQQLINNK